MASGAQLNRWGTRGGVTMLTLNATSAAFATPLTSYGTTTGSAPNDSGWWVTPIGCTKFAFQLIQLPGSAAVTGYTVSFYGTLDPAAYSMYTASGQDGLTSYTGTNTQDIQVGNIPYVAGGFGYVYTVLAQSSFLLPAPSEQSGTGTIVNPITTLNSALNVSMPLVAVRAVLTATTTPAGNCAVIGFAVP